MNYDQAEILGLTALSHMARNEEILLSYLALSGITPDKLRDSCANPTILGSILDYFLQNEKQLIAFCDSEDVMPDQISRARQLLPGGDIIPDNT